MTSLFGGSSPAGNTTTTTNQVSSPTAQGQKGITDAFQSAYNIQQQDPYAALNTGQIAPLNGLLNNSIGSTYNLGQGTNTDTLDYGLDNAQTGLTPLQSGGITGEAGGAYGTGLTTSQQLAGGGIAGLSSPAYGTSLGAINSLASGSTLPTATAGYNTASSTLQNVAAGNDLNPNTDPALQSVISQSLASALPAAQGSFTGGNRNDSGLASLAQAQAADNTVGNIENTDYQTGLTNQLNASQQLSSNLTNQQGVQATGAGLGVTANTATQNTAATGAQLGLNAGNSEASNTINADNTAGSLYTTGLNGLTGATNATNILQNYGQSATNAAVAQQNQNVMAPTQNLTAYEQALQGSGALNYGTNTGSTATPYYQNQLASTLGGVAGLTGLGNLGSQLAGYSGLAGSGGLLSSLFSGGSSALGGLGALAGI